MSEPDVPYGDEDLEGLRLQREAEAEWNGPRLSSACLASKHGTCSGIGVSSFSVRAGEDDEPTTCLAEWTCVCGCHVTLGVKF